jgi:hypothetical protein
MLIFVIYEIRYIVHTNIYTFPLIIDKNYSLVHTNKAVT